MRAPLRSGNSPVKNQSRPSPAKDGASSPGVGFSSVLLPATAPGLERDRAQPIRGQRLLYMPLAAFGVYEGEVISPREDGRVDIALYKLGERVRDLELTQIEVMPSRAVLRPGTCCMVDTPEKGC